MSSLFWLAIHAIQVWGEFANSSRCHWLCVNLDSTADRLLDHFAHLLLRGSNMYEYIPEEESDAENLASRMRPDAPFPASEHPFEYRLPLLHACMHFSICMFVAGLINCFLSP